MLRKGAVRLAIAAAAAAFSGTIATPQALLPAVAPSLPPTFVVDLMTREGSAAFGAQWKTTEAKIVEAPAISDAMPEFKTTYDIQPHAGESGFDDSSWPVIDPTALAAGRGGGRVSFIWFRTNLTMPARIGNFETSRATAVLALNVDNYAEVWVNRDLPREPGRPSPATIQVSTCPIVLCSAMRRERATGFSSRSSGSTGLFQMHLPILSGSGRRRSNSFADR